MPNLLIREFSVVWAKFFWLPIKGSLMTDPPCDVALLCNCWVSASIVTSSAIRHLFLGGKTRWMLHTANESAIDFVENCYYSGKKVPSGSQLTHEAVKIKITLSTANKQCTGKGRKSNGSQLKWLCSHILRYCQKQSLQHSSEKEGEWQPVFDGGPKMHQIQSIRFFNSLNGKRYKKCSEMKF